jgi:ribosomal protein S18 acetylase RimI-like enzyme
MVAVYDVVVHPNHRRKGIGTKLMNNLIAQLKKIETDTGTKFVNISLTATNEAVGFYESLGFARSNGMRLQ